MIMRNFAQRASVAAFTFVSVAFSTFSSAQEVARVAAHPAATGVSVGASNPINAKELFVNPEHAYPPSCINNPAIPFYSVVGDPNAVQAQVTLPGDATSSDPAEASYSETDTITVWRIPCSGGTSATFFEIDRPAALNNTSPYPVFPGVQVTQGTITDTPRVATDPNTFFSNVYAKTPVRGSRSYLLEYIYGVTPEFDYNKALTVLVDNFSGGSATSFTLPDYDATQYTSSSALMPINGYMSTNWANPNQGGEGIIMQVYDVGGGFYTLAFAWFTYDDAGQAFWLYGQSSFSIGTTLISAPTVYYDTGKFASTTANTGATQHAWGILTFSFPDCNHMNMSYNSSSTAANIPNGHGGIVFTRVANVNGITCQ